MNKVESKELSPLTLSQKLTVPVTAGARSTLNERGAIHFAPTIAFEVRYSYISTDNPTHLAGQKKSKRLL